MRATALHEDALLFQSAVWQTNAVALRAGEEAFLIDSPILPDELSPLPELLPEAGFPICGLIATHADWDHLLGRLAWPGMPLAVPEESAARLVAEPGDAARKLREFDAEWYVERPAPLSLATVEPLPVPGMLEIGDQTLELHMTGGHTADGMAVFAPWCGVLVLGDYVSPAEIPSLSSGGSLSGYRSTLSRLVELVERAEFIVPGHGAVLDVTRAISIIDEDIAYLDALEADGVDAQLPLARRSAQQLQVHADNAAAVGERG